MYNFNYTIYITILLILILFLYFRLLYVGFKRNNAKYLLNFSQKFEDYSDVKKISYILVDEIKQLLNVDLVAVIEYTNEKTKILSSIPLKNTENELNFSQELFLILKNLKQNNFSYIEKNNLYSEHFKEYFPLFNYSDFKILELYSDENKIITLEIYGDFKKKFNKNKEILDNLVIIFQKIYLQQIKYLNNLTLTRKNEIIIRFLDRIRVTLEEKELKKIILEEVANIFNADRVYFLKVNKNMSYTPVLDNEYLANPYVRSLKGNNLNFQKVWEQLTTGEMTPPVFVIESTEKFIKKNNFENTPIDEYIKKSQIKSSYPFLFWETDNENIYLLIQYTQNINILNKQDFEIMELITKQSYNALNQAKLYSKILENNKKEKLLKEIYSEIIDFQTEKQIYSYFAEKIMYILEAIGVVFVKFPTIYAEKIEYKEYFKATHLNLHKFKSRKDILNVLLEKKLIYICDIENKEFQENEFETETGAVCFSTIPINENNSILLFFENKKIFSNLDKNILSSISELLKRMLNDVSKNIEITNLREKFLAALSHDLYVPLIAQRNAIEHILTKQNSNDITDLLLELKKTNTQTEEMINALISIYKYESNKFISLKNNCNLNNLIEILIRLYSEQLEKKKISIINKLEDNYNFWGDAKEVLKAFKILFMFLLNEAQDNSEILIAASTIDERIKICIYLNSLKIENPQNIISENSYNKLENRIGEGIYWHLAKLILLENNGKLYIDNSNFCLELERTT